MIFLWSILVLVICIVGVIAFRTLSIPVPPPAVEASDPRDISSSAIKKLSDAVTCKTVSYADSSRIDTGEYKKFHRFIEKAFPLVHRTMIKKKFNDFTLLFFWQGTDTSLKPVLFAAHFDVVPANDTDTWRHPPFSGRIDDEYVWGRGTQDVKVTLVSMLEAAEYLIKQGFKPGRSIYFAFGGDEEIDGKKGAAVIADYLQGRGVVLEYVLDEGTVITDGLQMHMKESLALIAVAEKGHVNLRLSVRHEGGHASIPSRETAAGILCKAVTRIEKHHGPARLTGPVREVFRHLAVYTGGVKRIIFTNLWLFTPAVKLVMAHEPSSNALIRTTVAVTMLEAGDKENVLPLEAHANANIRIIPGETIESTIKRIRRVIGDHRVDVKLRDMWFPNEPVGVSRTTSAGYRAIGSAIRELVPDAAVVPILMCGSTDSKHYSCLTSEIYRFTPVRATPEDLTGIHGENERISKENIRLCVAFYEKLITSPC